MSNPFEDPDDHPGSGGSTGAGSAFLLGPSDDSEILEGFLCPICKADLKTPERLTAHVEQQHSEEQDLLKSLKEMFSFAKKKILNLDETANDLARSLDSSLQAVSKQDRVPIVNPIYVSDQSVGTDCDYLGYFKAVRNPRLERYASETNKLIIRLDKLLDGLPSETDARKRHEQSKVPWIDGKLVKLCPSCAKSFGLTRRQHHCRVCGSVMCDGCSFHLSFDEARAIVQPVSPGIESTMKLVPPPEESGKDNDSSGFRVCEHCLHLLMNRKEMQDSRSDRPLITKLYEKLLQEKKNIDPDIPMYSKIINSLYEGDSIYRLSDASALREKIGRAAERIDNISKTILAIPFAQGSREEALKKAIRLSCISFIKERMLSIPPLPAEEEIKKIQLRKKQETARRIERERRLALVAYEKYELQSDTTPYNGSSSSSTASTAEMTNGRFYGPTPVAGSDNWSGYQAAGVAVSSSADPLVDQINIVKGYIKQAREALRFEEVETLERNLSELTHEFYERQRRAAASAAQSSGN